MKKIILLLAFLLAFFCSFSQNYYVRTNGSTVPVDVRLVTKLSFKVPIFPDTNSATIGMGLDSIGCIFKQIGTNNFWIRDAIVGTNTHFWNLILTPYTIPVSNGIQLNPITNQLQLGGTFTEKESSLNLNPDSTKLFIQTSPSLYNSGNYLDTFQKGAVWIGDTDYMQPMPGPNHYFNNNYDNGFLNGALIVTKNPFKGPGWHTFTPLAFFGMSNNPNAEAPAGFDFNVYMGETNGAIPWLRTYESDSNIVNLVGYQHDLYMYPTGNQLSWGYVLNLSNMRSLAHSGVQYDKVPGVFPFLLVNGNFSFTEGQGDGMFVIDSNEHSVTGHGVGGVAARGVIEAYDPLFAYGFVQDGSSQVNLYEGKISVGYPYSGYSNNGAYAQINGVISEAVSINGGDFSFSSSAGIWIETSSSSQTGTLPVVAGHTGYIFRLKNRGSGTLSLVVSGGSSTIYNTSAVSSLNVTPGQSCTIVDDGSFWTIINLN